MQLVLLGGAPGVGKSTAAHHLLEEVYRRGSDLLVQWVEVEALWRHQPWHINRGTTQLRDENLRAVLGNARRAGVDAVIVTWVFATGYQYDLIRRLAPADVGVTTVQLIASEPTWRARFGSDPLRRSISDVDVERWAKQSSVDCDYAVPTDGLDGPAVGRVLADLVLPTAASMTESRSRDLDHGGDRGLIDGDRPNTGPPST